MSDQPPSYPSYPGSGDDDRSQGGRPQPGEQPGQQPGERPYGQQPPPPPYGQPPAQPGQQEPQYGAPYGSPPPAYGSQGSPYGTPYGSPYGATDPDRRPGTVTAACAITWVLAGITALLFGLSIVALLVAQDRVIELIEEQPGFEDTGISADAAAGAVTAFMAVFLVWSLIALGLAVGAFRRSNVARIALVVSAVFSAIFSLVSISSLVSLVTLVGSVAAIVLLFAGGANEWYSRRTSGAGPGYGEPGAYGQGWPGRG